MSTTNAISQSVYASTTNDVTITVAEQIVRLVERAFPVVRDFLSWDVELSELGPLVREW
ncbi:hypothetical protein PINS_up023610 [Pythium insidiosum]|nr:hypothetical protein PINS_up023610 [Pythium insidiosum]